MACQRTRHDNPLSHNDQSSSSSSSLHLTSFNHSTPLNLKTTICKQLVQMVSATATNYNVKYVFLVGCSSHSPPGPTRAAIPPPSMTMIPNGMFIHMIRKTPTRSTPTSAEVAKMVCLIHSIKWKATHKRIQISYTEEASSIDWPTLQGLCRS